MEKPTHKNIMLFYLLYFCKDTKMAFEKYSDEYCVVFYCLHALQRPISIYFKKVI